MKARYTFSWVVTVFAGMLVLNPAFGQESQDRMVERYTCKEVMRESGADRDVAIAFLHGFLLGKSGSSTFQIDVVHKQTLDFIERCLDHPDDKALEVMSRIKG